MGTSVSVCSESKAVPGISPNGRLVAAAAAASLPLFTVELVFAWVSLGFAARVDLQHRNSVLHHFFAPCAQGSAQECGASSPSGDVRCAPASERTSA
jgi:hypothetical protein